MLSDRFNHSPLVRRPLLLIACAAVGSVVLAGCTSSGLSHREVRGQDYATYAYAMQEPSTDAYQATVAPADAGAPARLTPQAYISESGPRRPVVTPARIAVAQIGEISPPSAMVKALREEKDVFANVQPISGVLDIGAAQVAARAQGRPHDWLTHHAAQDHGKRMRQYARDLGADYLFLYGGTLDRSTSGTGLRLADVTIIGAFIVPSRKLEATATASGSLIDVHTGRVALSVGADVRQHRMASSVEMGKKEIELLQAVRDGVVKDLATQLAEQVKAQATVVTASTPTPD
ncbi:MAG: hypothetical protein ABIP55_14635 [Tepidisphaeraceae bacterium]